MKCTCEPGDPACKACQVVFLVAALLLITLGNLVKVIPW